MVYIPTIPNPGDTLAASQPQIRGNFVELDIDFARNHISLTDATVAKRGKHDFCEFPVRAADPASIAGEGCVYTKAVAGTPQLFWQRNAGAAVQMTSIDPTWTVVSPTEAKGSTFLPGRLLLQYGYRFCNTGVATAVTFQNNFSAVPYSILLTLTKTASGAGQAANVVDGSEAVNGFNIYHQASGNHWVYWQAIGPQ